MWLRELWENAAKAGWSSGQLLERHKVELIPHYAEQLGWTPVGTRAGEGPVSVLRPVGQTRARAETMSAVHGLGAQPLHVDGSHMLRPPDIVVLFSEEPNETPTRIWKPEARGRNQEAAQHGLFLVGSGRSAFVAPALDRDGRLWRYDPVIMRPADERARTIAAHLDSTSVLHAQDVRWEGENGVLVIDNRKTMHGRAALAEGDEARKLIRMAFYLGDKN